MTQRAEDTTPAAKVIVKAWSDPAYKMRLLADPRAALREVDIEYPENNWLDVYDNSGPVHHAVICTQCSCYPYWLAPLPSYWKDPDHKARLNRDPAGTLKAMGLTLENDEALKIVDTTSIHRAMVIPRHPDPRGRNVYSLTGKGLQRLRGYKLMPAAFRARNAVKPGGTPYTSRAAPSSVRTMATIVFMAFGCADNHTAGRSTRISTRHR